METRECSKCHQVLPFDQANFKPDKKGKVGVGGVRLSSVCRPCDNERIRLREEQRKAAGAPSATGAPGAMGAMVTPGATGAPSAPGVMSATGAMGAPGAPESAKRVRVAKTNRVESDGAPSAPGAPKGRKYPHEDFTKHGFIIRRVYLERLRVEAWQHRQDITQALDAILAEHFRRT